jgi:hypothetical protein
MLQRVQSLYLFAALILGILMYFLPFYSYVVSSSKFEFYYLGLSQISGDNMKNITINTLPLIIIGPISNLLILTTIFLYKNRKLQMKLVRLAMLLYVSIFAIIIIYSNNIEEQIKKSFSNDNFNLQYSIGLSLPIIIYFLLFMALRGIKKDEELVRSADRIR